VDMSTHGQKLPKARVVNIRKDGMARISKSKYVKIFSR